MHVALSRSAVGALNDNDFFLALLFVEIDQCEGQNLRIDVRD